MTWKLCVWPKRSPRGPRWWKGELVARGVANLRLVNFIIASGRAMGAGGPVLSRGKAKRVPTHGKHAHIHAAGAFLPAQAVAPGVSLTGYPSVCPSIHEERLSWCWLEGCLTECQTEGRHFISKRLEVNAEIIMLWMKLDTSRLLDACIDGWIDGWMDVKSWTPILKRAPEVALLVYRNKKTSRASQEIGLPHQRSHTHRCVGRLIVPFIQRWVPEWGAGRHC